MHMTARCCCVCFFLASCRLPSSTDGIGSNPAVRHGTCTSKSSEIKISATIRLCGDANERHIEEAIACFRETLTARTQPVVFDLSGTRVIDSRFFGLLLMLRKHLKGQGVKLTFVGVPAAVRRMFRLNESDFLLERD